MRSMSSASSPNGRTPNPCIDVHSASHTLSASLLRIHTSNPRSPLYPVREIVTGEPAMLPVVTPKYGIVATAGTSAASRSRERGPWTARMP